MQTPHRAPTAGRLGVGSQEQEGQAWQPQEARDVSLRDGSGGRRARAVGEAATGRRHPVPEHGGSPLSLVGSPAGGSRGGRAKGGGPRLARSPVSAPARDLRAQPSPAQGSRSSNEVPRSGCRRYHWGG